MLPYRVFRIGILSFIGGTASGLFFSWSVGWTFLGVSLGVAVIASWCSFDVRFRVFLVFLGGVAVFSWAWFRANDMVSAWRTFPETQSILREGVIVREPESKDQSKQAVLRPISCSESPACPETFVLGIFPLFADIGEGDRLSIVCPLDRPERFSPDIDFPMILAKDGIGYVCRFPREWAVIGVSETTFRSYIRKMREAFESGIHRAIPEPESGLVAGLLLGGDDRLPKTVQDQFSRTGLSHIVAVSGYNVSIVAALLMGIFIVVGLYRQQAFWGALLGIGCFTVLAGAPASAVRAAIMASVGLLSVRIGRVGSSMDAIIFSGSVMLLSNPLLLRYDIGFQLSFLATIGIVSLAPLAFLSIRLGDILATTLAAEVFILPILLFHFHALPVFSLPANILVLPLVPIAMLLGAIATVSGMIVPWAAPVLGFPAFFVSRSILSAVGWISEYEIASMEVPRFGFLSVVLWYMALSCAVFFLRRRYAPVFSLR